MCIYMYSYNSQHTIIPVYINSSLLVIKKYMQNQDKLVNTNQIFKNK